MSIWGRLYDLETQLAAEIRMSRNRRENNAHCRLCGGVFRKECMKKVTEFSDTLGGFVAEEIFYCKHCKSHAPKYDEIVSGAHYKCTPGKREQCDEKGKVLKVK